MKFHIGIVLSISHSALLTDMGNIYKILNHMLDDNLFTHQLSRAGEFAKGFLIAQHPQLSEWDHFNKEVNPKNWKDYVKKAELLFGEELDVESVPEGVWTYKEPVEELQEKMSDDQIMQIEISPKEKDA